MPYSFRQNLAAPARFHEEDSYYDSAPSSWSPSSRRRGGGRGRGGRGRGRGRGGCRSNNNANPVTRPAFPEILARSTRQFDPSLPVARWMSKPFYCGDGSGCEGCGEGRSSCEDDGDPMIIDSDAGADAATPATTTTSQQLHDDDDDYEDEDDDEDEEDDEDEVQLASNSGVSGIADLEREIDQTGFGARVDWAASNDYSVGVMKGEKERMKERVGDLDLEAESEEEVEEYLGETAVGMDLETSDCEEDDEEGDGEDAEVEGEVDAEVETEVEAAGSGGKRKRKRGRGDAGPEGDEDEDAGEGEEGKEEEDEGEDAGEGDGRDERENQIVHWANLSLPIQLRIYTSLRASLDGAALDPGCARDHANTNTNTHANALANTTTDTHANAAQAPAKAPVETNTTTTTNALTVQTNANRAAALLSLSPTEQSTIESHFAFRKTHLLNGAVTEETLRHEWLDALLNWLMKVPAGDAVRRLISEEKRVGGKEWTELCGRYLALMVVVREQTLPLDGDWDAEVGLAERFLRARGLMLEGLLEGLALEALRGEGGRVVGEGATGEIASTAAQSLGVREKSTGETIGLRQNDTGATSAGGTSTGEIATGPLPTDRIAPGRTATGRISTATTTGETDGVVVALRETSSSTGHRTDGTMAMTLDKDGRGRNEVQVAVEMEKKRKRKQMDDGRARNDMESNMNMNTNMTLENNARIRREIQTAAEKGKMKEVLEKGIYSSALADWQITTRKARIARIARDLVGRDAPTTALRRSTHSQPYRHNLGRLDSASVETGPASVSDGSTLVETENWAPGVGVSGGSRHRHLHSGHERPQPKHDGRHYQREHRPKQAGGPSREETPVSRVSLKNRDPDDGDFWPGSLPPGTGRGRGRSRSSGRETPDTQFSARGRQIRKTQRLKEFELSGDAFVDDDGDGDAMVIDGGDGDAARSDNGQRNELIPNVAGQGQGHDQRQSRFPNTIGSSLLVSSSSLGPSQLSHSHSPGPASSEGSSSIRLKLNPPRPPKKGELESVKAAVAGGQHPSFGSIEAAGERVGLHPSSSSIEAAGESVGQHPSLSSSATGDGGGRRQPRLKLKISSSTGEAAVQREKDKAEPKPKTPKPLSRGRAEAEVMRIRSGAGPGNTETSASSDYGGSGENNDASPPGYIVFPQSVVPGQNGGLRTTNEVPDEFAAEMLRVGIEAGNRGKKGSLRSRLYDATTGHPGHPGLGQPEQMVEERLRISEFERRLMTGEDGTARVVGDGGGGGGDGGGRSGMPGSAMVQDLAQNGNQAGDGAQNGNQSGDGAQNKSGWKAMPVATPTQGGGGFFSSPVRPFWSPLTQPSEHPSSRRSSAAMRTAMAGTGMGEMANPAQGSVSHYGPLGLERGRMSGSGKAIKGQFGDIPTRVGDADSHGSPALPVRESDLTAARNVDGMGQMRVVDDGSAGRAAVKSAIPAAATTTTTIPFAALAAAAAKEVEAAGYPWSMYSGPEKDRGNEKSSGNATVAKDQLPVQRGSKDMSTTTTANNTTEMAMTAMTATSMAAPATTYKAIAAPPNPLALATFQIPYRASAQPFTPYPTSAQPFAPYPTSAQPFTPYPTSTQLRIQPPHTPQLPQIPPGTGIGTGTGTVESKTPTKASGKGTGKKRGPYKKKVKLDGPLRGDGGGGGGGRGGGGGGNGLGLNEMTINF